jgi:Ca-activated chloride channel family protein
MKLFLIIIISLTVIWLIYQYVEKILQFDKNKISLNRSYKFSLKNFQIKYFFLALTVMFLGISLYRPQWGTKTTTSQENGIDILFTLDVSQSMKAADIKLNNQKIDRLTMAKAMMREYVQKNPQNRYGLVIFAGEAFTSTPLTSDENAFLTFLEGVNPSNIAKQGTNITAALQASVDRFKTKEQSKRGKAIIIISDGGEENENYDQLTNIFKQEKIIVYTIGIGTNSGAPVPEREDVFGDISYKTYQGETVISKLNDNSLKNIAKSTNGDYFHAKSVEDIDKINSKLKNLKTSIIRTEGQTSEKEEQYQIFVSAAAVLFALYLFWPIDKNNL